MHSLQMERLMMDDDGGCFSQRALQERNLAASATDVRARLLHLDLADRYEEIVDQITGTHKERHI